MAMITTMWWLLVKLRTQRCKSPWKLLPSLPFEKNSLTFSVLAKDDPSSSIRATRRRNSLKVLSLCFRSPVYLDGLCTFTGGEFCIGGEVLGVEFFVGFGVLGDFLFAANSEWARISLRINCLSSSLIFDHPSISPGSSITFVVGLTRLKLSNKQVGWWYWKKKDHFRIYSVFHGASVFHLL